MAILNRFPAAGGGSGLLVPGEEYVGFVPEKLSSTTSDQTTIKLMANVVSAGGSYIILQDYQQYIPYLVIPAVDQGESVKVTLTGSDTSRANVDISRASSSFTGKYINIACADTSKPISQYVKAYGYGGFAKKTVESPLQKCTLQVNCTNGTSLTVYGTNDKGYITETVTTGQSKEIPLLCSSTVVIKSIKDVGCAEYFSGNIKKVAGAGSPSDYTFVCELSGDAVVSTTV